ncbi:MAG: hypothetical protein AAFN63_19130, partial [Pseudomonadota bacterium]
GTTRNLTKQEKGQIYKSARKPVDDLMEEYKQLQEDRRKYFHNLPSSSSSVAGSSFPEEARKRLSYIRDVLLPSARETARNVIYQRMNSVGMMGVSIMDDHDNDDRSSPSHGTIQVDFHGLHVDEAKQQLDEHILPILSTVGSVIIITGIRARQRQLSREEIQDAKLAAELSNEQVDNISTKICVATGKLRPALQRYIEHHPNPEYKERIKFEHIVGNEGCFRIVWKFLIDLTISDDDDDDDDDDDGDDDGDDDDDGEEEGNNGHE